MEHCPTARLQLLRADRAVHTNGVWTFYNVAEYSQADDAAPLVPSLLTNVLAMPEFDETPRQIRSEIKISSYQSLETEPRVRTFRSRTFSPICGCTPTCRRRIPAGCSRNFTAGSPRRGRAWSWC